MREIRPSGSEGGETGQPVFPTPIEFENRFRERCWRGGLGSDRLIVHTCHRLVDKPT
jgi:hypothetical protein